MVVLSTIPVHCADVIITTKSEKLDVKIMEVSSTEIRYKKMNNLQGPTFVISTNDVNTILYENGEVQVIEHKAAQPTQQSQSYQQPAYGQQQPAYAQQPQGAPYRRDYGQKPAYGQQYMGNGYIVRQGSHYSYNGQAIVLHDFLYQNCPPAYEYWRKNFMMECAGWGMMSGGVVLVALTSWNFWPMAVIGGAALCAGVPMGAVGYIRRAQKAPDMFNAQCASRYADVRVNLQASQNGIGLAFAF